MGLFSSDTNSFDQLFVSVLQQIYYAERQIAEQLELMIPMATAPELRQGFETHLRETREQYTRLEEVFRMHGSDARESTCPGIDGILKAGNAMVNAVTDDQVKDAALTHAAQMVEHYEIAQYGTLSAWARELGRDDCAQLLHRTLEEEKATDQKLTQLAEARINRRAEQETHASTPGQFA
ncbi:MAG TPA: ferritin-like domain-containing protein [Sphingomicrobium sp.]|nr:ferritin-like domain-containing protein [Sphingomicrobium sp.]